MKRRHAIKYVPIESLVPYANNARQHSPGQVRQIAKSIQRFGFINPVLVDKNGTLIAGHGRLLAARELGLQRLPTVRIDHLTEAERRAYALADNKIAMNATWDDRLLRVELTYLASLDLDFGLDLTGFSTPEIDLLMAAEATELEPAPPPPPARPVTRPGDLWILGKHRVLCGDCRDERNWRALLGKRSARMVITDPPYNVRIDGHARGLGQIKHREFALASGEMTPDEFTGFLQAALSPMTRASADGALLYVFMDWRHLLELCTASGTLGLSHLNLCIWAKTNGGMGSLYRSGHELVFVFKKGTAAHVNNVELGKHGRNRTNVWSYPGVNTFGEGREDALAIHPTVKPTPLVADAILDCTHRGDLVLDGFLGSGTTLLAAEKTGRMAAGMELDPGYVDVALTRWRTLTGKVPILAGTRKSFDAVAAARGVKRPTEEAA